MRYYSVWRPLYFENYPQEGARKIVNFTEPEYIPTIGREARGYVEYAEPLPDEEVQEYGLIPEGMLIWYCVTSRIYDDGTVESAVSSQFSSIEKPENKFVVARDCDIYMDWFSSRKEAEAFTAEMTSRKGSGEYRADHRIIRKP